MIWLTIEKLGATSIPHKEPPLFFFTNTAADLLQAQLNLDLHHIEVYPTNQYGSSVHRLLQVAANIFDSRTNNAETPYPICLQFSGRI